MDFYSLGKKYTDTETHTYTNTHTLLPKEHKA